MAYRATLIASTDATSNVTGGAFDLGDLDGCALHVDFTGGAGNLAGTLILGASNDGSDFVTVAGSSQAVTSSTSHIWNVTSAQYRYIRPSWTFTSGTGNITCSIYVKDDGVMGK